ATSLASGRMRLLPDPDDQYYVLRGNWPVLSWPAGVWCLPCPVPRLARPPPEPLLCRCLRPAISAWRPAPASRHLSSFCRPIERVHVGSDHQHRPATAPPDLRRLALL